jgi:hypothetical protein
VNEKPKAVAWDDDIWWLDSPSLGSAGYVSSEMPSEVPVILVPDGHGDYRKHEARPRPKGKLGF